MGGTQITYVVGLPKMFNLNPIMKKYSDKTDCKTTNLNSLKVTTYLS